MNITHMEIWRLEMPLREPYTIAYETFDHAVNVFVRLETGKGISGYGCASPEEAVTGETPASVVHILDTRARELVIGADPLRYAVILENLRGPLRGHPAAKAAVDMALYDLLGKIAGQPVFKLLGGFRTRFRTSITLGIMPPDKAAMRAREMTARGFRCLKLKGGRSVEADAEMVRAVRRAVGPTVELRFDANQGYDLEQAKAFVTAVEPEHIVLIEQPTPADRLGLLGRVTAGVPIPVMADESMLSLRDAFKLARNDLVDMVNIKLMKVGGIYEALHVSSVARAAGLEIMVGCMDEAELAIAAALHFALARPSVRYADLDGALDLIGDPTVGLVTLRNGFLYPSHKPGFGLPAKRSC